MTKMISEILEASEPLFSIDLEQLERACGRPNVDIRLTSDITAQARQAIRALGLDPNDTTGHELYQALRNLIRLHEQFLGRWIGLKDVNDVASALPAVVRAVERLDIPHSGWFIKASVAKRLLKASPPKKVMKMLGYRSIDSMLKREPVGALYAAMRWFESDQWFQGFMAKYDKLTPSDFEIKDIEIVTLPGKRWQKAVANVVRAKRHNVIQVKELGSIVVLPLPVQRLAGVTITLFLMLLAAIHEIRLYSAYWKLQQVQAQFGRRLAHGILTDEGYHAQVLGHAIHWRVMQRHYGQRSSRLHPETFEPHLQAEDLAWRKAEATLYRLEPALYFWHDLDYVSVRASDGKPISFNLMDAALNYVNQLPFEKRLYSHAVAGLWNELYGRYVEQPAIEEQCLKQFDGRSFEIELIGPEMLGLGV